MKIKTVENNLKELRFNNGSMSQQHLADLVGCTRQTINSIEKNRYAPSFLLVSKIAHIFGVKPINVIKIKFEKA